MRPGLIVTPQNEAKVPQALKDIFLDNIEVARYGTPEDIAAMCVYLASDESSYFTGQVVTVDGRPELPRLHGGPVPRHGFPHLVIRAKKEGAEFSRHAAAR